MSVLPPFTSKRRSRVPSGEKRGAKLIEVRLDQRPLVAAGKVEHAHMRRPADEADIGERSPVGRQARRQHHRVAGGHIAVVEAVAVHHRDPRDLVRRRCRSRRHRRCACRTRRARRSRSGRRGPSICGPRGASRRRRRQSRCGRARGRFDVVDVAADGEPPVGLRSDEAGDAAPWRPAERHCG